MDSRSIRLRCRNRRPPPLSPLNCGFRRSGVVRPDTTRRGRTAKVFRPIGRKNAAVAYLLWRMSRTSVRRAESEGPAAPRPVLACELRPFDGGRSPVEPPCGTTMFGYAEVSATVGPARAGQKAAERTDTPPVPLDA